MKICPACDRTYHDDELNFCLMCGVALVDGAVQPTVVINSDSEQTVVIPGQGDRTAVISTGRPTFVEEKKHGIGFWIGVTLACIVGVSGATLGGFFLYFLFTGDEATANRYRTKNTEIPAKTPAKPKTSPTVTASPSPDDSKLTPTPANGLISNEIDWETTAEKYAGENFERATFTCPADGSESTVFGSDIYSVDSSVCTAAVHAGKITFEKGGKVTIIFGPGLSSYVTTTRNGITTNMFGNENTSFVFE